MVKSQIKITPWCCTSTTPDQYPYQLSTSATLWFQRYFQDKSLKVKVTTSRSKLYTYNLQSIFIPSTTKYQLNTPYSFREIPQTRFYRSRSLRQSQSSNQGHTMTLPTYKPQPMSLLRINFLHLMVSEI